VFTLRGYIPNDTAFGANTFLVLSSRLKPGCARGRAIVNGLLALIWSKGNKRFASVGQRAADGYEDVAPGGGGDQRPSRPHR
jgi:hypothetical protein